MTLKELVAKNARVKKERAEAQKLEKKVKKTTVVEKGDQDEGAEDCKASAKKGKKPSNRAYLVVDDEKNE